jgi:hypothetical protein
MLKFHEDCTIIIPGGKDVFGDPIDPTLVPVKCRAKEKYQMVRNQAGETVVSNIEFWFYPETDIQLDYMIKYKNVEYQIISIQPKKNTLGETIYKVVFV